MDSVIVAARLLQFGSGLVLFGAPLFFLYGFLPGSKAATASFGLRALAITAAAGVLIGVIAWVSALAAVFFPDNGLFDPEAIWTILTETQFGTFAFARCALSVTALICALVIRAGRTAWTIQVLFGAAILASFAWTGHGIYDVGWAGAVHTGADVLHLLAAGVWIGALVVLSILLLRSLRKQTETETRRTMNGLERFSAIGFAVVAVLVLTGLVNSWFLVGIAQWQALFTTDYGILLTIKLALFGGMLLLAAANRYRFSPRLTADLEQGRLPRRSLRALRASVLAETGLAILVLAAVAMLGTLEPPVSGG